MMSLLKVFSGCLVLMAVSACGQSAVEPTTTAAPSTTAPPASATAPTTLAIDHGSDELPNYDMAQGELDAMRWDEPCQALLDDLLEAGAEWVALLEVGGSSADKARIAAQGDRLSAEFEELECSQIHFDIHSIDRIDQISHSTANGFVAKEGLIELPLFRVSWEYLGIVHLVIDSENEPFAPEYPPIPLMASCEDIWDFELLLMTIQADALAATSDDLYLEAVLDAEYIDGYLTRLEELDEPDFFCDPQDRAVYLVNHEEIYRPRNFWSTFAKYAFYEDVIDDYPESGPAG